MLAKSPAQTTGTRAATDRTEERGRSSAQDLPRWRRGSTPAGGEQRNAVTARRLIAAVEFSPHTRALPVMGAERFVVPWTHREDDKNHAEGAVHGLRAFSSTCRVTPALPRARRARVGTRAL